MLQISVMLDLAASFPNISVDTYLHSTLPGFGLDPRYRYSDCFITMTYIHTSTPWKTMALHCKMTKCDECVSPSCVYTLYSAAGGAAWVAARTGVYAHKI